MSQVADLSQRLVNPLDTHKREGMVKRANPETTTTMVRGSDKLEVSQLATILSKMSALPPVRQELIDRVKSEIQAGTYESPEKIDAALDEMVRELLG
jgi:anti-sigma28 factor (negative regulator of flagellin synthesis)